MHLQIIINIGKITSIMKTSQHFHLAEQGEVFFSQIEKVKLLFADNYRFVW